MTKMASMPIYGKTPLKIFSLEPVEQFQGNLVSGTMAHHNLLNLLPWVDLDLYFGKVKFSNLGFYIEKCDSDGFFGNYCSL